MAKKKIVFIVGPTAVGKTGVSVVVARQLKGEIINADAMQVYKEISILNNKPDSRSMRSVPHHLVGFLSVGDTCNVAAYSQKARRTIRSILDEGKLAVVVGGSGLYVRVLLDGIFDQGPSTPDIRQQLKKEAQEHGTLLLYRRLQQVDPQAARRIHPHDLRRIIRALEIFHTHHQPISFLQKRRSGLWGRHKILLFGLNMQRQDLIKQIDQRVERMFDKGAVREVRLLTGQSLSQTARGMIGIREIQGYLRGNYPLEHAKELMRIHTRQYAKRQMTWFRQEKRLRWLTVKPAQKAGDVAEILIQEIQTAFNRQSNQNENPYGKSTYRSRL